MIWYQLDSSKGLNISKDPRRPLATRCSEPRHILAPRASAIGDPWLPLGTNLKKHFSCESIKLNRKLITRRKKSWHGDKFQIGIPDEFPCQPQEGLLKVVIGLCRDVIILKN
jgi:hypothetical protein